MGHAGGLAEGVGQGVASFAVAGAVQRVAGPSGRTPDGPTAVPATSSVRTQL
ncbi:hypothetical protein [Streptomyces justiciae]|uniref:hypothetical protein n=1 Tax=Streptomyces justiciae TaxID=2780140 RepID=UPI0021196BF8|nr:hypothetical protein [Streptomyces justiciae]MCW8384453.1 hypothetical protein [Streptomyces justiciae]